MNVYSIKISVTRDELDHEGIIPDANWPDAWECYENMMRGAAEAMFPDAEVSVIERPSTRGIVCGADDGLGAEAEGLFGPVADRIYGLWCGWVSNQTWITQVAHTYGLARHVESGEGYALEYSDGKIVGVHGPVYYADMPLELECLDYDADDAEWAREQPWAAYGADALAEARIGTALERDADACPIWG